MRWQLNSLYEDFNEAYNRDFLALKRNISLFEQLTLGNMSLVDDVIERYIVIQSIIKSLSGRLKAYPYLRYTVNSKDEVAKQHLEEIELLMTRVSAPETRFKIWLKDAVFEPRKYETNAYHLYEMKKKAAYTLTVEQEDLFSSMNLVAGESWGKLQKSLASTLKITLTLDGEKKVVPISKAKGYLTHSDPEVRLMAFDALKKGYETVDTSVALCLSNIKRQGNLMSKMRGFDAIIDETLCLTRMTKHSLQNLLKTMNSFVPVFRKYLKAKAAYLELDQLKMCDLSVPLSRMNKRYTIEEAKSMVLEAFRGYSEELYHVAHKAFLEEWVDFEPREGKRGGAFCYNMPYIGESRISLNYNNGLINVMTLAHELGHAYHGSIIKTNTPLNWSYPMPLAETASLFCEQIMVDYLLKKMNAQEQLLILEMNVMKSTRLILGMLSRYWFEETVVDATKKGTLSKKQIKEMMKDAQLKAYGDSVDPNYLDEYAWLDKPHYYYLDKHFYNFPYAFGFLFSKGLYQQYKHEPDTFKSNFDFMLLNTTQADIEDVARIMSIDMTTSEFWNNTLSQVKREVDQVCEILDGMKE